MIQLIVFILFCIVVYWIAIDIARNVFKGMNVLYIGKDTRLHRIVRRIFSKEVYNPRVYQFYTHYNANLAEVSYFVFKVLVLIGLVLYI